MSSFSSFAEADVSAGEPAFMAADEVFFTEPVTEAMAPEGDGAGGFLVSDGPILPPPSEMRFEEGSALREWRRQNAVRLEEKEKVEKDILREIIEEANVYKDDFNKKWKSRCESNRVSNREKEKLNLASQEKFHSEASKTYWKAIAELIPKEIPNIEKKGKKDKAKKTSIIVIQGPKPGKPTELSRMRQLLVKLKHNPPPHMKPVLPPSVETTGKDAKGGSSTPATIAPTKPVVLAGPGSA